MSNQEITTPDREARVTQLARQLWEEQGCPEGRADEHWYKACMIVDAELEAAKPLPTWLSRRLSDTALKHVEPEQHGTGDATVELTDRRPKRAAA